MILNKLQRPINPQNFIPCIDGFRFFAIITVCILHVNNFYGRSIGYDYYQNVNDTNSWSWFINRCGLGVELFFAISGFVIAMPFLQHYFENKENPRLKSYFLRRLTRLEVPYLLSCILIYSCYIYTTQFNFFSEIGHLLSAMTYTHSLIYGVWPPFNPVIWSLEVEIQFYILAPWLIKFIYKGKNHVSRYVKIAILMAITLYLRHLENELATIHLRQSVFSMLHYFLIGFIVAEIYIRKKEILFRKHFIWDFLAVCSFYALFKYAWYPNQLYFCMALLLIFISIFKSYVMNWICTRNIIFVIGGMCYTIYLLHYPLFHFFGKLTAHFNPFQYYYHNLLVQILFLFPLIFVVCSIYFILIEKPCMNRNWPQSLITFFRTRLSIKYKTK